MIRWAKFREFYDQYKTDVQPFAESEYASAGPRINSMQAALIREIEECGLAESIEFDVSHDFDMRYFVCGVIYSLPKLSTSIVDAIMRAFKSDEQPESWVCHLNIENPKARAGNQFYVKGNGDILIEEEPGWTDVLQCLSGEIVNPSAT